MRRGCAVRRVRASRLLFSCRPLVREPSIDSLGLPERDRGDKSKCETLFFVCENSIEGRRENRERDRSRARYERRVIELTFLAAQPALHVPPRRGARLRRIDHLGPRAVPLYDEFGASCPSVPQLLWALWARRCALAAGEGTATRRGEGLWGEAACGGQRQGAGEGQRNLQGESKSLTTVN